MNEEIFRQLAESIQEVFWMSDPGKQRMLYVSPAYQAVWGRSPDSIYAEPLSFLDAVHPEDRERVRAALARQPEGGYHEMYRIVRPDGSIRWIRDRAFPIRDADGTISRIAGIALDITERKVDADRALAASEERYRAVVENANDGIVVTQEGFIKYANPRSAQLSDRTMEQALTTPFIEMIHPEDRARVYNNYLKRTRGEPAENNYVIRVLTPKGETRWLKVSAVAIQWDGKPATLNFLSDVGELVQLQQDLKRTLAEREAVLETTTVGILRTEDGRIQWINPALEQDMLGYARGELIGRTAELMSVSHAEWARMLSECVPALEHGGSYEGEWLKRRKDGTTFWCHTWGRAIDRADLRRGTIWFYIDITERKRAEEETRRALEKERELSELKSRFVAMTSHEFRTPLATIMSSVELLGDYGERLPAAERREMIGLIKGAIKRMNAMIDQVLLIGSAEARPLAFKPKPRNAGELCERLVEEARLAAGGRAEIVFVSRGATAARLIDKTLLRHALGNLLSNAVKYSPEGGTVVLALEADAAQLVFRVSDQGIGIPEEDRARLFETFHRASNAEHVEGTGLGLAIVRQCVVAHRGSIEVESALGKGSTFTLRVPAPAA